MSFDNQLAQRIREYLAPRQDVAEKQMMGGLIFMVNDKMCVGVIKDDLMVRIDPERREELLAKPGCRPMDFTRRRSKGFVFIEPSGIKDVGTFAFWLEAGLSFNSKARSSRKK